jgi:membrane protein involved in colicin uptake
MADQDFIKRLKEAGRNDDCPFGSGQKYKKCHLQADEDASRKLNADAQAAAGKAAEAEAKKAEKEATKEEGGKPKPEPKAGHAPTGKAKPAGQNQGHKPIGAPRKMV